MKKEKKQRRSLHRELVAQIRADRKAFIVFVILRALVIAVMVRSFFLKQYESVFVSALALVLLFVPPFLEKKLRIELPTALEILLYAFVFCAEILGEIGCYYIKFPMWDTMLHTVNGFMFAAIGFCMVDLLNRSSRFRLQLSPLYQAIVAFCFSMTIGVLWEFFEFAADVLLHIDMQKDFLVDRFASVVLDETRSNIPIEVSSIVKTTIETASGQVITLDGYLDIGLIDTMKDLLVNFVGAVVFSFIGFFYVKHRGKGKLARGFIPIYVGDGEEKNQEENS